MQEIVLDWIVWMPIIISSISLLISIAVYFDSRKKEGTRKHERLVESLSKCHTLLEEAIRMHPSLNTELAFVLPNGFADEISKKADTLTELSWMCSDLAKDIQSGASILKSMVQEEYPCDDEYMSNKERKELLEKVELLRSKLSTRLELLQN